MDQGARPTAVSSPPAVPEGWTAEWSSQYKQWFYQNIYIQTSTWEKPTQPVYPLNSDSAAPSNPLPPTVVDQGSDRVITNKLGSGGIGGALMGLGGGLLMGGLLEHEWDKHHHRPEPNQHILSSTVSHTIIGSGMQYSGQGNPGPSNAGPRATLSNLPAVTKLSSLSALSWSMGRNDIFGLGADHAIHHKVRNGSAWQPAAGWEYLGGNFISAPTAISCGSQRLDLFAIGSDKKMYHKWFSGTWGPSTTEWECLGGDCNSMPTAASWAPNCLDVFVVGTDNQAYHKSWNGSRWYPSISDWESLGGACASALAVVARQANCLNIFVVGTDGQMYHKWYWNNEWGPSKSGWDAVGGSCSSAPAITSWGPERLDLFVRGTDNKMYRKWWDHGTWGPSYTSWEEHGGSFSSMPVVTSGVNRIDMFGLGTNNVVLHQAWDGNSWKPSQTEWELQGGPFYSAPAAASWGPNRIDVFNIGVVTGDAQHRAWNGFAWGSSSGVGWESLGGRFEFVG